MQVVAEYDYYTLDQARKIIRQENRQKAIKKRKIKERKKALLLYYIKQKLMGLCLIVIGLVPIILENDGTVAAFTIPFGVYLLLTKKKIMMMSV